MTHRMQRVCQLMKRELGVIIERDLEFKGRFVTVHDIDITPDLKQAFVYIGILGPAGGDEEVVKKLTSRRPQLQRALYKRVTLRNSPQLTFRVDHSIERGVRVLNLIESLPEPAPELTTGDEEGGVAD